MPFNSNPEDSPPCGNPGAWGNTWFLAQIDGMPWKPGHLMHRWQWVPPLLGESRWLLRMLMLGGGWSWLGNRAQYPPFERPAYCWAPSFHLAQDYACRSPPTASSIMVRIEASGLLFQLRGQHKHPWILPHWRPRTVFQFFSPPTKILFLNDSLNAVFARSDQLWHQY